MVDRFATLPGFGKGRNHEATELANGISRAAFGEYFLLFMT